jgi:hypothetical protein
VSERRQFAVQPSCTNFRNRLWFDADMARRLHSIIVRAEFSRESKTSPGETVPGPHLASWSRGIRGFRYD